MATQTDALRAVLDSNVLVAAGRSKSPDSPNREVIQLWRRGVLAALYSDDTLVEYARMLRNRGVPKAEAIAILAMIMSLGIVVTINFFHLPKYPVDSDDIAFLLCAWNGLASHLISYDSELLGLSDEYRSHFAICKPIEFLQTVRPAG